jgi:hypothetical protein
MNIANSVAVITFSSNIGRGIAFSFLFSKLGDHSSDYEINGEFEIKL